MRVHARLRLPDGREVEIGPGELVGRTPHAAAMIDDPRVAEAHAIVSLRHGALHLLALRRMVTAGGRPCHDVVLQPGVVVQLADGVPLTVLEVVPPSHVLGLAAPGQPVRLLAPVVSLVGTPPRVLGKPELDAHAQLWSIGPGWRLQLAGGAPRSVQAGDAFEVAGVRCSLVAVPNDPGRPPPTTLGGVTRDALRVVVLGETVQLHRHEHEVLTIAGTGARIVAELVRCQGATAWEILARAVWPEASGVLTLRHRWDVALGRLRTRLRDEGVRELLRADGAGQLALELHEGDIVDDRT